MDSEHALLDKVHQAGLTQLFSPDQLRVTKNGRVGNYGKGFYKTDAEDSEAVMNMIRLKAEACSNLQGFDFLGSLEGGLGSGFLSSIMRQVQEEYHTKIIQDFIMFETIAQDFGNDISPYNQVLAFDKRVEHCNISHLLEKSAFKH